MNEENKASASHMANEGGTGCTNTSCCPPKAPVMRGTPKIGRNDPCACNSGRKFKKCCGANT